MSLNSPLLKVGPAVADVAAPAAQEQRQPALRRRRVGGRGGAVAARHRVAEVVEGRARRDQRFLVRGQRLGGVDRDALVVVARRLAEGLAVGLAQVGLAAQRVRQLRQAAAHLARIEQRAQALRPQVVVGAVPAEPALLAHVGQPRRVADARLQALGARQAVAEAARRLVAAGAGQRCRRATAACRGTAWRRRRWPPAAPDTRFDGSRTGGGGQGPKARMRGMSSSCSGEASGCVPAAPGSSAARASSAACGLTRSAATASAAAVRRCRAARTPAPSGRACGTSALRRGTGPARAS